MGEIPWLHKSMHTHVNRQQPQQHIRAYDGRTCDNNIHGGLVEVGEVWGESMKCELQVLPKFRFNFAAECVESIRYRSTAPPMRVS